MHETKKLTSIEHFSFSRYAGLVIGYLVNDSDVTRGSTS